MLPGRSGSCSLTWNMRLGYWSFTHPPTTEGKIEGNKWRTNSKFIAIITKWKFMILKEMDKCLTTKKSSLYAGICCWECPCNRTINACEHVVCFTGKNNGITRRESVFVLCGFSTSECVSAGVYKCVAVNSRWPVGFCFFVSWHINLCRLFNAKAILLGE